MKDPNDCTWPHTNLCLHDCVEGCAKRSPQRSGWRKVQIEDAEEEAWREMTNKQGSLPDYQAWLLTDKNINSLQVDSIQRLIDRLKHAHHTDLCVRINGQDEWFQADWLKHMVRVTPPQRTEPPAWFPAVENILNEYGLQAIDFVADFKAAMKDAEQSQRTEEKNT